ncbi:hypothetical protein [Nocardioides bruguierae]|uniref:hypothetical protein n=1 Tax=Nocardioides bruguierae TaxID=2945102 RepID=UPI002020DD24|nr:hypothetical protein [Nocardioides bruguierae]MCL8025931.1 hypothetical protein [Nocardioides bruguierae]
MSGQRPHLHGWEAAGRRALLVLVPSVLLVLLLRALDFGPVLVPLVLVVALLLLTLLLLGDAMRVGAGGWTEEHRPGSPPPTMDLRLAAWVRRVETHLTSRGGDDELEARVAAVAADALRRRHGLSGEAPLDVLRASAAADLLGAEVHGRLLAAAGASDASDTPGPHRPWRADELAATVRRLEEI